MLNKHM